MLQGVLVHLRGYRGLQEVTRGDRGLLAIRRGYKGLQ